MRCLDPNCINVVDALVAYAHGVCASFYTKFVRDVKWRLLKLVGGCAIKADSSLEPRSGELKIAAIHTYT